MRVQVKRVGRGNLPSRISTEYPKLLYHVTTGHMRLVVSSEEQASLGPEWGAPQPDVKFHRPHLIDDSVSLPAPIPSEPIREPDMSFEEYPKALYHPVTKALAIVNTVEAEIEQFEEWGISKAEAFAEDLPNPFSSKPVVAPVEPEATAEPEAPEAAAVEAPEAVETATPVAEEPKA